MLPCRNRLDEKFLHEIALEKARIEMGQQHERQKQQSADHGAVEQNGDDGVIDDGLLLEDVVKAQQDG